MMAECMRDEYLTPMLLYLVLLGTAHAAHSIYPRIRLSHNELWQLNRTWVFQAHGASLQPQTMVLDEGHERLYVGAKNTLFSLSLDQVNTHHREIQWASTESQIEECLMKGREKPECANYIKVLQQFNHTHLLVCGTGAFNPVCAQVRIGHSRQDRLFALEEDSVTSGRGRCPYNPKSPCTSTLSRGELYIGLYTDYWENDGALCRLNNQTYTRTERDDRQQLSGPKFVGSAVIPDNDDRDDDKVYFFFTEREMDAEGLNKAVYTRVGRVCANDQGGQRMLVNRWSSFLKTRLICSVAGPNGIDTHFDDLEDVFVLKNKDGKNPEIFGLFSTTSAVFKGYAVCVYNMDDIRAAFNGPFAYREKPEHRWTPYEDRVPYPRPGSCASKVNGGGFSSSKEFPDEVLRFVRSHPVMHSPVLPRHRRPVLLQTEPGGRKLTQIAVDRVQAQDGHYHVLYIGTDDSVVLKVITFYNKDTDTMEEVLLEELQLFKVRDDERVITISHGLLFLHVRSSDAGVYVCQTVEHGYVNTLLRITLHVLRGERVESTIHRANDEEGEKSAPPCHSSSDAPPDPSLSPRVLVTSSIPGRHSRLWYKEFLKLIGYGDAQRVAEYCEKVWCTDKKRKKTKKSELPTWTPYSF
ncbi:hypothetical protein F2P81_007085 [Scophthalmus maximus]|uniref:Sema domain-containing protein n=1 Tax=Scophthalmus maximus TaxID=52904 RepID=A0A6A4T4Q7_SCOMX|nr:hypothetical protein F2P81_007085 [Scophthalmus maximus]